MIPVNLFTSCIRFSINHYKHLCYLHEIGFLHHQELVDSGCFVVKILTQGTSRGYEGNESENPTHLPISAPAMEVIWSKLREIIDIEQTIFVDFGCGTGFALLSAMTIPLKGIVGVDLHKKSVEFAVSNTSAFGTQSHAACTNVEVHCADMLGFQLPQCNQMVLFMYEPLWTVPFAEAHDIYQGVLIAAKQKCSGTLIVAYVFAGHYGGNALDALKSAAVGGELISKHPYSSLHFGVQDHVFYYKIPTRSDRAKEN